MSAKIESKSHEIHFGHFLEQLDHRYPPDLENDNNAIEVLGNLEAIRRVMEKQQTVYAKKLAIVQKLKAEDEEVKAAQERIEAKEKKKKQLEAQFTLMVQKHEEDVCKVDLKFKKAKEAHQNAKMEYGKVKNTQAEHTMKYRRQEKRAKDARNQRAQLEKWLDNHGIAFRMAPLNGDDSGTQQADELLIYITKVDPNSPTRDFKISLDYLSVEHKKFKVRSLFPVFDEAYDVIQKANDEQDLLKFMIECKRYWLRDCTDNSSGLPPERTAGDQTEPLFDSPSTTFSDIAD